jgi:hypothetical protein
VYFVEDKLSKIQFNSIFKSDEIENFKKNINLLCKAFCAALTDAIDDIDYILEGNKIKRIHKQSRWKNELFHLKKKLKNHVIFTLI